MPLTLGLTGMDPATETALKAAFIHANARIGSLWQLVPETEAEHIMVDMDSMYGPMSWLRLHAAGKHVIGLTTAPRSQTDFRLGRPFDSDSFSTLLRDVAAQAGVSVPEAASDSAPRAAAAADLAPPAASSPPSPAPQPAPSPPAASPTERVPGTPAVTQTASDATDDPAPAIEERAPDSAAPVATAAAPVAAAPPATESAPQPAAPRERRLGDWLAPGALERRVRYRSGDGVVLLIDPSNRSYHGPAALKPLAPAFASVVQREDFADVDDADWSRESTAAGAAQPLQRLQWLDALLAGKGALLPGHDPDGRYRLNKWPQTEREYPKHFRIATAMMKGPATVRELADASGMPVSDVADFINASLATGFADLAPDEPVEPIEATKPTGLFGRLRGK